jgi:hypothetical protein
MCSWWFAQEFELLIVSQSWTSLRFNETGHVSDGWWRTRVVEDMCVWWSYDVDALPVNNSAPDGSTPPINLPFNSYKNQTAGMPQLFWNAWVGQYNVLVTQLAIGNPLCTEWLFFNYTITITEPPLPPPPPSTWSDSGTWSTWTWDVWTGDIDDDENNQEPRGGAWSSINSFTTQSNHDSAPSFSTQSVWSQENLILPEPVCEPKKLIRARVYAIANNFALQNQLSIKEMIQLTALKQRYLAKANSPKERNALIEKWFCITDNKQKMLDTWTDAYRKIQWFQDFLLLEYEMD